MLVAEMHRVKRCYQTAVLADDLERAADYQAHYYALEALRKIELVELLRHRRHQEIERELTQAAAAQADMARRLTILEGRFAGVGGER